MRVVLIMLLITAAAYGLDKESINRGKKIYDTICFACHGKDLEGATGHNLKDAEWIHGSKPEEILKTLKKGFPEKGMVAFEAVYSDEQLRDVVNFILSKQEGLRDLKYKIYHGLTSAKKMSGISWDSLKPQKSGTVKPSFVDLNVPEVDEFGIAYEGTLIIPAGGKFTLNGRLRQNSHIDIFLNGKKLNFKIKNRGFKIPVELKTGKHKFALRYVKIFKYSNLDLSLDRKGSKMPLSMDSFIKAKNVKHIVAAVKEPLVIRKRIDKLPSKTIAVAFPEKVNYSFNPVNGSVNGFWLGEFLDIAPNINGRGNQGSKNLGPYLFAGTGGVDLLINGKSPVVDFTKYSTYKLPEFFFKADNLEVSVSGVAQSGSLILNYRFKNLKEESVSLKVPEGVKVSSKSGSLSGGILKIKNADRASFSIVLSK